MPKDLKELIQKLREIFQDDHINVDEVRELMESYRSNPEDWKKYAMFDKQGYTRNLVDEVKGKFNLIVLCWGKGHGSPIHDHSKSDCFMKMLQGELKETQFDWPKEEGREMTEKSHSTLKNNSVAYIHSKKKTFFGADVCILPRGVIMSCVCVCVKRTNIFCMLSSCGNNSLTCSYVMHVCDKCAHPTRSKCAFFLNQIETLWLRVKT
ncbi:cysteine dioxygenase type 1-like isoform X1 [Syngnathus scovelli]|uniref:cysteine dioxygenase type 1-like isoform X1 n=1 Tax=Syngnathus scovelli TaxID=161590 RepID=UPI0021100439|nr:cysteine dioxygenase type 1-like isoform X1 [Syngnathus scovelli]